MIDTHDKTILEQFFARDTRDDLKVPMEVQWFGMPFDLKQLDRVALAIKAMEPIFNKAFQIYRKYPLLTAYWSDRTGIPSFVLDLAAVKLSPLPQLNLSSEIKNKAFEIFEKQFSKTDNTRLGYIIDRKNETLMTLRYKFSFQNVEQDLMLYFHLI